MTASGQDGLLQSYVILVTGEQQGSSRCGEEDSQGKAGLCLHWGIKRQREGCRSPLCM